jgi:acyl-CoA synthetase (AMP-forming)/AMP-acid ligase II
MRHDPILSRFDDLVARMPARPLVHAARRSLSISDLDALSRTLARRLAAQIAPDHLVALATPNGPAFLAAFLALRRAGLGAALLDASAPAPERTRAAAAIGATALLTSPTGWPLSEAELVLVAIDPATAPTRIPGSPVVKVTSGSTGAPRGVVVTAENLCADEAALFASMALRDDERILAAIPMAHSYGLSSVALPAVLRGSLVILPDDAGPLAPLAAARAAEATFFPTVPAYLQGLVRLRRPELWPPSLRLVVSAGAVLSAATAAEFRAAHGQPVHCFYGASECGGICYDREGGAAERGSVGTPVEGVTITLDDETAPAGAGGTVVVRSPAVGVGYLPAPSPGLAGGVFRSSDRAAWAGSELRLLGRSDGLINVKGKKVDPGEIEGVLSGLAGVDEVVVLGVPSRLDGSQTVRAVVACPPGTLTAEDVVAFCRARLAEHKVPRSVRLVPEIPRTARGKVDRAALGDSGEDLGGA